MHIHARSKAEQSAVGQSKVKPRPALLNSDLAQQARTACLIQWEKKRFFGAICPPIWEAILTHFRLKTKKREKVMAFGGDLEPRHISSRNCIKTGRSRTCKMCQKHSKYAVGCKVGFLQKKSSKWPARAPFWRPLGSLWNTLGTKWHSSGGFLRGWNFGADLVHSSPI